MAHTTRTILFPTDLSVGSLNTLKVSLSRSSDTRIHAILMYAQLLPGSITDLLFRSPQRTLQELVPPAFNDALAVLRNRFEHRLYKADVSLFHGRTRNAFDQYTWANKVDEIHVPLDHRLVIRKNGFDPMPLVRRSSLPLVEVDCGTSSDRVVALDHLQVLFDR